MEIDFLYFMKLLAISALSFITYRLLILEKKGKTKDHYTRPAWNFFIKKLYAEYVFKKLKKRNLKLVRELKNYESEAPKILANEDSSDSLKFYGNDHEGNSILIKFTRRRHRIAEIWLVLRIKHGNHYITYTLPDHPNTKIANATPRIFEGSGLKLECLVPYSKWRITYAGMLRKGITQFLTDDESNFQFFRLNFIWAASNDPSFWPNDWSTKLMASAIATEKWRDGKWMNLLNLKDAGGYGQFGASKGQVRIYENDYAAYKEGFLPKIETIELNLPGIRQRRWGPHKNEHLHRTGVILSSMKDGTVLEVGAFSSKIGVTHSQFGSIRFPNGITKPINWTDFHLASLGEYQDSLPEATIVEIEAGNKKFVAVVTFRNSEKVPLFGGSVGERWNAFIVPVDIMCNTVRGYGIAVFWYPRNIRQYEIEEFPTRIKRIFHRLDSPSVDKQVISFADKDAQSILVAGGKASSLAILRIIQETKGEELLDYRGRNFQVLNALVDQFSSNSLNRQMKAKFLISDEPITGRQRSGSITKSIFPDPNDSIDTPDFYVPQGFIISVSAFFEHIRKFNEIRRLIKELEAITCEKVEGDIKEACKRVHDAFTSTSISDELKTIIAPKLNQINFDGSVRFAVRSSGINEDGDELSSAGQNETFLGLRTNEEVFDKIIKCWASVFSFQSVMYRKQNIQPVSSGMAVVIQKMVAADSAGVLFSRHFLNGDPSVIVISANFGLGESVVSAKSEPDIFIVKRNYKGDEVELISSIIGDKKIIIEMGNDEETKETKLDDEKRKKLCLSEDIVLRLSRMAIVIEKFFGTPRDIEFAVKDKKIYLLQSRSITALNNFTDYELIHENDTAVMSINDNFTTANCGEVIPGALSHLTQDIVQKTFDYLTASLYNFKCSGLYLKYFGTFNGHIFINVTSLFMRSAKKNVQILDRVTSLSIFGCDIYEDYPKLFEIALSRNVYEGKFEPLIQQLLIVVKTAITVKSNTKRGKEALENMKMKLSEKNLLRHKTCIDVLDLINREKINFRAVSASHYSASTNSIFWSTIAFAILLKGAKKLTTVHQRDITLILSSIGNVESANVLEMLKEIAKVIKSKSIDEEFLKIDHEDAVNWLNINCPEAHELYKSFVERHGHRGLKELDIISKTWAMQPEKIIEMIKSNLTIPITSGGKKLDINDIVDQLNTPLSKTSKSILKKIIPRCHKGVQYREEFKSMLTEAVNEIRRAVIYLSTKMVNEGSLPDKDLIYHLSMNEIKAIIKTKNPLLINKARRRQKMYPMLNELRFDNIIIGMPKPNSDEEVSNENEDEVLVKGMPVCGGKVVGNACVIKWFSEIHKLQKGDILITYCTDIAWSPYFSIISGICTEVGGLISHGAVVARECNIPCIVGAQRATDKIKNGQKIILNADEGVIKLFN